MSDEIGFVAPKSHRGIALAIVAVAALTAASGAARDPARTWPNVLLDGFFVLSPAVSALFFLAIQRLCGARWSAGLRRVAESLALALPAAAVILGLLWLGRHSIYPWSRSDAWSGEANGAAGRVRYLA